MKVRFCGWLMVGFIGLMANAVMGQSPIERGKYLVEGIAACGNCHGARDAKGNTPLALAVMAGRDDLVDLLLMFKANPNLANSSGQTPLILAVNTRNEGIARTLINKGADPDQTDNLAGLSARDYAVRDSRNPAMVALFKDAPKKVRAQVSGPRL